MALDERFMNILDGEMKSLYKTQASLPPEEQAEFFRGLSSEEQKAIRSVALLKRKFDTGDQIFHQGSPYSNPLQQLKDRFAIGALPSDPKIVKKYFESQYGAENIKTKNGEVFLRSSDGNFYPTRLKGGITSTLKGEKENAGNIANEIGEFAGDIAQGIPKAAKLAAETIGTTVGGTVGALGGIPGSIAGAGLGAAASKSAVDNAGIKFAEMIGAVNGDEAQEFLDGQLDDAMFAGAFGSLGQAGSKIVAPALKGMQLDKSIRGLGKFVSAKTDEAAEELTKRSPKAFKSAAESIRTQFVRAKDEVNELFKTAGKKFNFDTDKHRFLGKRPKADIDITDIKEDLLNLANDDEGKRILNKALKRLGRGSVDDFEKVSKLTEPEVFTIFKTLDEFVSSGDLDKIDKALLSSKGGLLKSLRGKLTSSEFKKAGDAHKKLLDTFGRFDTEKTRDLAKLSFRRPDAAADQEASSNFLKTFFKTNSGQITSESRKGAGKLLTESQKKAVSEKQLGDLVGEEITKHGRFNFSADDLADDELFDAAKGLVLSGKQGRKDFINNMLEQDSMNFLKNPFGSNDVLKKAANLDLVQRNPAIPNFDIGNVSKKLLRNQFDDINDIRFLVGDEAGESILGEAAELSTQEALAKSAINEGSSNFLANSLNKGKSNEIGALLGSLAGAGANVLHPGSVPIANFLRSAIFSNQ